MNRFFFVAAVLYSLSFADSANAQTARLDSVFAPVVVGVPPSEAYIGLSKMQDGEIRHYNYGEQRMDEKPYYLSSRDTGFTWRRVALSHEMAYADVQSPVSGEFVRVFSNPKGVYAMRTEGGIDGGRTITKIDDVFSLMIKPPVFIRNGRRIVVAAHRLNRDGSLTYVSDDDGLTWKTSNNVTAPLHAGGGFHKGIRWNHGAVEPTVIELSDGRLWMVMRTSQDRHYQAFSEDGGLTWSDSSPSPFYGTITMPTFCKLNDGRLLFLWTNATPLPELEGTNGVWDDVFTNRNVTHVAISEDDGRTWIGMRELFLDVRRNAEDFGSNPGVDKSVHQAQCIEVGDNKVLVALGQHRDHRKMVLFDLDWLYEKGRSNDFETGLDDWSTFKYYKGFQGHCGYNRTQGGRLVDHSDKPGERMLNIRYQRNDTLVCDNDGAVWNFPVAKNGELTTRVKLPKGSQSVTLVLNDRWFNSSDSVAKYNAVYKFDLDRQSLKIRDDKWHSVTVEWSYNGTATVFVDRKRRLTLPLDNQTQHGVSYVHFIGGNVPDSVGIFIESVEAQVR